MHRRWCSVWFLNFMFISPAGKWFHHRSCKLILFLKICFLVAEYFLISRKSGICSFKKAHERAWKGNDSVGCSNCWCPSRRGKHDRSLQRHVIVWFSLDQSTIVCKSFLHAVFCHRCINFLLCFTNWIWQIWMWNLYLPCLKILLSVWFHHK